MLRCRLHGEPAFASVLVPERRHVGAMGMAITHGDALHAVACNPGAVPDLLSWLERESLVPAFAAQQQGNPSPLLKGSGFKQRQQLFPGIRQWPSHERNRYRKLCLRFIIQFIHESFTHRNIHAILTHKILMQQHVLETW